MAKFSHDNVLDAGLKVISGDSITNDTTNNRDLCVCSSQPTTRTEAVTTYCLAKTTLTKSTDFTIADNTASPYGRKVTTASKSSVSVTASGTANYIAICDGTNLLVVTTCTSQALTSGNTVTIPAFSIIISDPT